MLSLNLLPWRLEQHQKAFWRFMWQGLIWFIIAQAPITEYQIERITAVALAET